MAVAIVIPRLGWNMDEGDFAGWLKQDGAAVLTGDPLFSLASDKATQDVEAIDHGILRIAPPPTGPNVGDRLAVGAVIGYLVQPGELAPFQTPTAEPEITDNGGATNEREGRRETERMSFISHQSSVIRPVAVPVHGDRPVSSPLARRLARELGVDLSRLRGSGRSGRIRRADVLAAAQASTDETPPLPPDATPAPGRVVPVSPLRRTIAARLVEGLRTTAPVTLTTTADASNLVSLRAQFKAADPSGRDVPSYTDFVVKLSALALRDHPRLNARWDDDCIVIHNDIHIGIAVDTEAGLLVPVILDAAGLGLRSIAARARMLIEKARARRLSPNEMQGGTFTVTNLGAFGVEAFTPIVNPPECAILGMGRIARIPAMQGDQAVGRERIFLSLTFDHRIVDGAPAARFLQDLTKKIENPGPWLME
jgi:pyruvate dehydrogenase E2 component (dihydrolipoamide acetyltransferase)